MPVAVYLLDAKHGAKPLAPSFAPPGTTVGVHFADGPNEILGGSIAFSGSHSSYIKFSRDDRLDTRYSITLLAMVYPESHGPLVHFGSNQWGTRFTITPDKGLLWKVCDRGNITLCREDLEAKGRLEMKQWNHVGATFDYSTGFASLWINRKWVAGKTFEKREISTNNDIRIGAAEIDPTVFKGRISCLQIYSQALKRSQIRATKDACSPYKKSKRYCVDHSICLLCTVYCVCLYLI